MDYVHFNPQLLECLVEDPNNDIIRMPDSDAYAEAMKSLLNIVCSADYNFKITEVKPMNGDNTPRFVEAYNYGQVIPINKLRGVFGPSAVTNDVEIPQGEFFTFFDGYPPYQSYQCQGICMNVSMIKVSIWYCT